MKKVFATREWPGDAFQRLSASGFEVSVWAEFNAPPLDAIKNHVDEGVFALITTVEDSIPASLFQSVPELKIVAQAGVGYDNINVASAASSGVWVSNTPGVLDEATADLAFALMCSLARHIPQADRYVRDGNWTCWHPSMFLGKEFNGSTIGIVGLGRIGLAFARRCTGFGMRILYTARSEKREGARLGASLVTLDQLLHESDIVSLHIPLSDDTRHLMNADRFDLMKSDALFVNTSRGGIVDQDALKYALDHDQIGGAAIDVTDPEPLPVDHPLLAAKGLIIAPHIGSAGENTRRQMAQMAVDNVINVGRGERPLNALVDLE